MYSHKGLTPGIHEYVINIALQDYATTKRDYLLYPINAYFALKFV